MEIKDVHVWKPIGFTKEWEQCSTVRLDALLPSWTRKHQTLKEESREYKVFMERLKRQHAIETGIVEKLYDLSEGVTETFIKEGFVESYLQHGDTNIPPGQLMAYLQDNFDAIDFVFDVVKNDRPITNGFIKELHQLITKHQHTAEGRDQFGHRLQIPLLKGAFKERENNPTRADGTRFIYCPPIHVAAEMDRLVEILDDLEKRQVKPLLIATWLHHAFVQIHPFQDGNGRLARLLASSVLVKHGLFPLTVKRLDAVDYFYALEMADENKPQFFVDFVCDSQNLLIETVLNMDEFQVILNGNKLNKYSLELPKEGAEDFAYRLMRGLTESVVPIAGSVLTELFGHLVSPSLEKRREKWMEYVAKALQYLESRIDEFSLGELAKNEEFISLIIQISRIAIKTHQDEKLFYLKNSLENCYLLDLEYDVKETYVRLLEQLSPSHLIVLSFFYKNGENLKEIKDYESYYYHFNQDIINSRTGINEFMYFCKDLQSKELLLISDDVEYSKGLKVKQTVLLASNTAENFTSPYIQISEVGNELIKFINRKE